MQMHGADFTSLHEVISPEILPLEFGGQLEPLDAYSAEYLFEDN
jgi:hypothetical protein